MAKKKDLTQVILNDWGETKMNHSFFKTLSNEAYIGYVTAMVLKDYNGEWSAPEIFAKASELIYKL